MATRADLLRRLKSTPAPRLIMTERWGHAPEPRYTTPRRVVKVQSNAFKFEDGSYCELPVASLIDYDGENLTIYQAGYRPLSESEQAILSEWERIKNLPENQNFAKMDMCTDTSIMYHKEKAFLEKHNALYLACYNDLKYFTNPDGTRTEMVRDNKVKGSPILKYKFVED